MKADVIVVGAGPAGCAAALTLAQAGHAVILAERAPLPQHKACGDALLPEALRWLARHGLEAAVRRDGLALDKLFLESAAGEEVELSVPTVTLHRTRLHALLHEQVRASGIALVQGEVTAPLHANDRLCGARLRTPEGERLLSAPLVLLTSGARPDALKQFGVCQREAPTAVAIRSYYRDLQGRFDDALRIVYPPVIAPGYGWVFPLPDHLYNIGFGHILQPGEKPEQLYLQRRFEYFTSSYRPARLIAAEEDPIGTPCGSLVRSGLSGAASHADGLLVAGEALGSTSPLVGDGVGKALVTGELAAEVAHEALRAGRYDAAFLGLYAQRLQERFGDYYRGHRQAEGWLRSTNKLNILIHTANKRDDVRQRLAAVLTENAPPTKVLSFWKLLFS